MLFYVEGAHAHVSAAVPDAPKLNMLANHLDDVHVPLHDRGVVIDGTQARRCSEGFNGRLSRWG
jgi:hypothetical protein